MDENGNELQRSRREEALGRQADVYKNEALGNLLHK